jgi:hypothetical protein
MITQSKLGLSLAAVAAFLALTATSVAAPVYAADKEQPGRCYGVNNC